MPRFFDDYSNTYLTHDSSAGRKQQRRGWKFRENFKLHYEKVCLHSYLQYYCVILSCTFLSFVAVVIMLIWWSWVLSLDSDNISRTHISSHHIAYNIPHNLPLLQTTVCRWMETGSNGTSVSTRGIHSSSRQRSSSSPSFAGWLGRRCWWSHGHYLLRGIIHGKTHLGSSWIYSSSAGTRTFTYDGSSSHGSSTTLPPAAAAATATTTATTIPNVQSTSTT